MKKTSLLILVLSLLYTDVTVSQTYTIDPGHTAVLTKVVRFGVVPVIGRFNDVSGSITYNPDDLGNTKATILIKTESYTANNSDGEAAIKSDAFLDVANFEEMKFEVNDVREENGVILASGTLLLHGVEKQITFPVTLTGPMLDLPTRKQSVGITGSLSLNRLDYGVGAEMKFPNGAEIIGSDVAIEFYVLAIAE